MDEQESKITQYLVPSNVSTRFEFFPGFGWYEFKIVLIALAIGASIFFVLGLFTKTIYVDANNIPIEMTIGADGNEMLPNVDGMIEKKVPLINMLIRLLMVVIPGTSAFFLVKRDPSSNMSLLTNWNSAKEFKKRQRLYIYKYNSGSEV